MDISLHLCDYSVITDAACISDIVCTTSVHALHRCKASVLHIHINMYTCLEYLTQIYPIFSALLQGQALCVHYVVLYSENQSIYDYLTCLHIRNVKQLKEK